MDVHRRVGDARLLRMLGHYSVGQGREALEEILARAGQVSETAQKLASLVQNSGTELLTVLDPEYPACFRALEGDAPPFLYVQGDAARLKARSVAIIGTRRPSAVGRAAAKAVATAVVAQGWIVVSGNAPGVDCAAHETAVKQGGETLVCPPAPLDQYEQKFRGENPGQITVVSPFAPGLAIDPWMFLRRNTLVAAHCHAAYVAETGTRGGTLDTVKKLRHMRRPIFATDLPEEAQHRQAHAMLAASGGVDLLNVSGPGGWTEALLEAAENCEKQTAVRTPVLDDLFPEEFLNE